MGILETILFITIFIWLVDLSYSRSKILKFIVASAKALEESGNRIKQLENKLEEKISDSDLGSDD